MENLERLYKMGNLWKGESLKRVTSHSDFLLCDKPKKGYKKGEISKLRISKTKNHDVDVLPPNRYLFYL